MEQLLLVRFSMKTIDYFKMSISRETIFSLFTIVYLNTIYTIFEMIVKRTIYLAPK